jgi:predicted pyridoxine 5'-phosphate oxidase superfamily flavin-nucleotide-binding protein
MAGGAWGKADADGLASVEKGLRCLPRREQKSGMAKQFPQLEPHHHSFIAAQHMFFTASAAPTGRVNMSPRSTDMFRVLGERAVLYLDRTGSGNETAAHLRLDPRLTIMFCAVAGPPLILRLYGQGRIVHRDSAEFAEQLARQFGGEAPLGARQMVHLDIELVQSSCGYGVPLFEYQAERPQMDAWARAKGVEGIEAYWREKNQVSGDGFPTGLFEGPDAVTSG